ncbi:hypothetical protein B0I35DRAFT_427771 [Stachybotrys elegans]|uniref:Pathway-specific nitrogen regulator n=1 Tax=Stachybotrys elegans TaxID=80388 RepID=A0A8K0SZ09_9HYPO|nr:hypothetical protein B0I35DRAFT_427771 [Stachybotrys elegans]
MTRASKIKPEDLDFEIHVDPSCLSEPMDEQNDVKDRDAAEEVAGAEQTVAVEEETKLEATEEPTAAAEQPDKTDDDEVAVAEEESSEGEKEEQPEADGGVEEAANEQHEAGSQAPDDEDQAPEADQAEEDKEPQADTSAVDDEHREEAASPSHSRRGSVFSAASPTASPTASRRGSVLSAGSPTHSRRDSVLSSGTQDSHRRSSLRTEALIQAAARDIVAQMELNRQRDSAAASEDGSYKSRAATPSGGRDSESGHKSRSATPSGRYSEANYKSGSPGQSGRHSKNGYRSGSATPSGHHSDRHDHGADDGGDSSSQHDNDDDVFSENSPRSSMGSVSENDHAKMEDAYSRATRSPRISNISQYEQEDDFVPTIRGAPRPTFRSPSSVKAMQMSSPPASVMGSPRSSRRTPLPTPSRLGSPSVSAQYSPKKTPPRFRRETPPLVLLHVTLLPLRWMWSDVLEQVQTDDLSREAKTVLDAWRQLQDRMGDTVLERGILLPHPQSDYEVLEERLLEALELPMRRRARILECGHYLGPANESTLIDDTESEDEDYYDGVKPPRDSIERKTHWCSTCHSEIRYDALGPGKIFRVKVYASNGLMKAGAWEACWKEMERVDVELEPIVEPGVHEELSRIASEQEKALELQEVMAQPEEEMEHEEEPEEEPSYLEQDQTQSHIMPSSPPDLRHMEERHMEERLMEERLMAERLMEERRMHEMHMNAHSPQYDVPSPEERRRMEEERLKEIYGHTPPAHPEHMSSPPRAPEFMPHEAPPSPSAQAYERRQERRQASIKTASLPELLLEAARVLMQDKKNVMIGLLGVLVMMFALRSGQPSHDPLAFQTVVQSAEASTVTVTEAAPIATTTTAQQIVESVVEEIASSVAPQPTEPRSLEEASTAVPEPELESVVSSEVVRVVETVTETEVEVVKVTATRTETYTETETEVVGMEEEVQMPDVVEDVEEAEPAPEETVLAEADEELIQGEQEDAVEDADKEEEDEKEEL